MTLPHLLSDLAAVERLALAERPGIILDFDGTLSEIAPTPGSAVINSRSAEALKALVVRYQTVAVLSGRSVDDLAQMTGIPELTLVGNHGAESIVNGRVTLSSCVPAGITEILDHLKQVVDVPGLVYEDKRFSASIHFRQAADCAAAESRLRRAIEAAPGLNNLDWFWGRMVLEIRPKTATTKGDAIATLVSHNSLDAVMFVGDDTTDIDGMCRLGTLDVAAAIGVAVVSKETPAPLIEASDYRLNGVDEVADLLELLVRLRPG